jgi:hypothetical protein
MLLKPDADVIRAHRLDIMLLRPLPAGYVLEHVLLRCPGGRSTLPGGAFHLRNGDLLFPLHVQVAEAHCRAPLRLRVTAHIIQLSNAVSYSRQHSDLTQASKETGPWVLGHQMVLYVFRIFELGKSIMVSGQTY